MAVRGRVRRHLAVDLAASTSWISARVNVCIWKNSPSAIASVISSALSSRIRSAMRALLTITSTAATRPPPIARQEPLADHAAQDAGEDRADLLLLVRREELDHAADRLGRVDRVHRREDEVAGLGGLERGLRGLGVAELADQDHVRVLAQRAAERLEERLGVEADLALVDDAAAVGVQDLDRILDRDDVLPPRAVDVVDHRGERRRLSRAGGAGDEDEAAVLLGEAAHAGREARDRSKLGTSFGITRNANEIAPRCRKTLTRKRGRSVAVYAMSRSPVLVEDWSCPGTRRR